MGVSNWDEETRQNAIRMYGTLEEAEEAYRSFVSYAETVADVAIKMINILETCKFKGTVAQARFWNKVALVAVEGEIVTEMCISAISSMIEANNRLKEFMRKENEHEHEENQLYE